MGCYPIIWATVSTQGSSATEGNVIALEPKFVIPHVGAVGIENTYAVMADNVECLTPAPEEIQYFDV